ncbi:MAG: alpha/beta fold hydrolase [Chloroflexota bacterium]|nr:alpha/beta fold hydrolase [Chloroflexota bacterium]
MLCLLGPPAVLLGEVLRPLKLRPKALALLVRVALDGPVSRADLADQIFPAAQAPRAALRWHLTYLRAKLPEPIRTHLAITPEQVALHTSTDVEVLQRGAKRLREAPDDPGAAGVLALYRGDLCAGLTVATSAVFDTWLYVKQEWLRRVFRQATVAVARQMLATGGPEPVIEPLAQLVSVDPYYEEGHCLLIEASELLGRREAAAAAYQRYQRILRQELQIEPPLSLTRRYEPDAPSVRIPPRDSLVALSQLTLHVVDWPGAEPPILAIHGSTMSAYTFTALAERLTPEIRFVAVDLRGHGFSDKPPTGYSVNQHVEDLRELLAVLGLRRPVLLGFSIGGAIAAFLAARTPCSGLILRDGVIGDRAFTENAAARVIKPWSKTLELRVGGFDEYLTRWRAEQARSSMRTDEAERILERTIRYELAPLPDGTYRRRALRTAFEETWASLLQSDSLGALAQLRCPTLIVQATRPWIDGRPYLTDEIIAQQRRVTPHAQMFVARQSTHPMLARDPEPEMVEVVRDFVRSARARNKAAAGDRGPAQQDKQLASAYLR